MTPFTILMLTKNEEANICRSLKPLIGLSDDIIVVDTGSTDNTIALAKNCGVQVITAEWLGYAATKNFAHQFARHDWILSLDADEEMTDDLRSAIKKIFAEQVEEDLAFKIKRKLVYCGKVLHHGSVSNEFRLRLYNKKSAQWNQNEVHEDIEFLSPVTILKLQGFVLHHSSATAEAHRQTLKHYATLFAQQKIKEGKSASFFKIYLSPLFGFLKNYFFRLGFLDGSKGLEFALAEMDYTRRKYRLIGEYQRSSLG